MFAYRSIYFDDPPEQDLALDIFEADGTCAGVGIFFVHGGGWGAGTRGVYHQMMRAFGREGIESASVAYRLTPGSLFFQIDDVRTGLRIYLDDRASRGLSRRVVLHGCSAGAHLALMAALDSHTPDDLRAGIVGISVQAPALTFEPWTDILPSIWSAMQKAVGRPFAEAPELYAQASPIRHLHKNMPPVLILHSENEHMFPLRIARQFQEDASRINASVEIKIYPNVEHGFLYGMDRWQQQKAYEDILAFLRKCAKNP